MIKICELAFMMNYNLFSVKLDEQLKPLLTNVFF